MKNNDDSLAFALRQTYLATLAQQAESLGGQTLQRILTTEPSVALPAANEQRLLDRLAIRLTTPTLGYLLRQRIQEMTLTGQLEWTGLPETALDELCNDAVHPTAVPVMRMKRLVQFLKLTVEQACAALQKTADYYHQQHTPTSLTFASVSRLPFADQSTPSLADMQGGHFLFESDEALELYLNRLSHELEQTPFA